MMVVRAWSFVDVACQSTPCHALVHGHRTTKRGRAPGLAIRIEVSPEGGNQWPPILKGERGGGEGADRAIERNDPVAIDPRICVRAVEVTERLLQAHGGEGRAKALVKGLASQKIEVADNKATVSSKEKAGTAANASAVDTIAKAGTADNGSK